MGVFIGVHLLNQVAIPALVLVYYFKKYKPTTKGVILALAVFVMLAIVLYGIILICTLLAGLSYCLSIR